jgi:hypothetical protein
MSNSIAKRMMVVMAGALAAAATSGACSNSTTPAPVTASVTCTAPVVAQISTTDGDDTCTIGAGSCSDGNTYILECQNINSDTYVNCGCAVDGVSYDESGVEIAATTCPTANTVTKAQVERAWLDCGVQLSF